MLIPEDFAQLNYRFGGSACPSGAEVTLGVDHSLYGGTITTLAEDCYDAMATTLVPLLTTVTELEEVLVKYGPNATGPSAVFSGTAAGSSASEAVPPNTSVLFRKSTAAGGRTGSGRLFLPGYREDRVNGSGSLIGTAPADLQGGADDFLTALNAFDVLAVLLHGEDSPVTTPTPITALVVQGTVATQRRRLRR